MAQAEKEILKGLDTELKKAGVKKGTKRGAYKKKIHVYENQIKIDEVNELINTEIKEPIKDELTHTEFIQTIEVQNDPVIENKPIENDNSGQSALDEFIKNNGSKGEYKEVNISAIKPNTEYKETKTVVSDSMKKLINGRMLLNMCNVVFPTLIVKIGGIFNNDIKAVNKRDLKLTPDQINDLKECADEVAVFIFDKVNPITAFFIMLTMSYYGNLSEAIYKSKLNNAI